MFNLSKAEKRIVAIPLAILAIEIIGVVVLVSGILNMFGYVNNSVI